jgi:hypothetical protein
MIEKFLKARHWQIFLLVVGIPLIAQMVVFAFMMSQILQLQPSSDPAANFFTSGIITSYTLVFVVGMLAALINYLWMYSVGVGLKKYLPEGVHSRTNFFVFCLVFPVIFFILFALIQVNTMFSMLGADLQAAPETLPMNLFGYLVLLIPLQLFALFCAIYALRFVAKITKSVELKRRARFSDYIGYFFLVWLYPIGIWIIQPKINAIVEGSRAEVMGGDSEILDA